MSYPFLQNVHSQYSIVTHACVRAHTKKNGLQHSYLQLFCYDTAPTADIT